MFKIKHIQHKKTKENYIELVNLQTNSYAKIALNLGGSLQVLCLENKNIIKDLYPVEYKNSYASAVLFPFTNRIKDGKHTFKQQDYQLELNKKDENNAIHGLIYNKNFSLFNQEVTEDFTTITLNYSETKKPKGFPFNYSVFLKYTITKNSIELSVSIKNDAVNSFPFSLGWHPYFYTDNLYKSFLTFKSHKKLLVDKRMIPIESEKVALPEILQIKDKKFDDCFILVNNTVGFKTPNYNLNIVSTSKENYLQIYTPRNLANTIAIEPMTAPSNSFNNKLGLQILKPTETYQTSWTIKLIEYE